MATYDIKTDFEETVVQKLNELFGNVLNIDVIKSVAVSCHYDVNKSSDKLLEISNSSLIRIKRNFMVEPYVSQENKKKFIQVPPVVSNKEQRKSKKTLDFERTVNKIQNGSKVLVIIRGVPGCGKSYLAKRILECTIGFDCNYKLHILSTDDFFCRNGQYQYDASKISEAHGWNHNRAFQAISRGFSPVIIDNTNTQMWEMKPYAMMATDYGYIIEILEPDTHWCYNDKELAKRNTHGVQKSKIRDMLDRYEKNVTAQKLLSAYNLTYQLQKPPQPRLYPPLHIDNSSSVNSLCNYNEYMKPSDVNGSGIMKSKSVADLNPDAEIFRSRSQEALNLMEFNDDESMDSELKYLTNTCVKLSEQNPVDKILMYNNEPMNQNSAFKPLSQTVSEVIKMDSSDYETQVTCNKLFPDLETAWGITESALRSWDIVTPLKYEGEVKLPQQPKAVHKVMTRDWSSNTDDEYFRLLRSKQFKFDSKDYTLLETVNRDINSGTPKRTPAVLKVPMLDKSCLTEDIFEDYDNHMSQLESLFPMVSQENLKYWYTKCKGDLEWTIEFVLENQGVITSLIEDSDTDNRKESNASTGSDTDSSTSKQKDIPCLKEKKIKRHRQKSENIALKKIIESKIDFNEHHYSKNVFKIKQSQSINRDNIKLSFSTTTTTKPSTSKQLTNQQDSSTDEFDEFDYEIIDKPEQKPVEMVELNLGENFVDQLETKFGDANMSFPKGFQPVVQVPVTLARQLYTFYIESVCQQMENQKHILDTLIKEDEDFSRKLQASEERAVHVRPASNFKDIIDEQMAQSIYQKEVDKWKELNPDNLAAMLTKQKLFSVFPKIDKDALVEILHAHDNKYQDTVDTLLASTGTEYVIGTIDSIREPPLIDEVVEEMKEAQKSSSSQCFEEHLDAKLYREEAGKYLRKRSDLYQKAQKYHQRGMTEVAQFYSRLASQQTLNFDRANNMAVTAFLDEHSKRLQDFNTIDLHFLYVKEAIPALDLFLDTNINLLRQSDNRQTEYVQIITGRGNNSENGISRIKPAVISRLKRRNIKYCELNPGLLKAKVSKTSFVTSELQNSTN